MPISDTSGWYYVTYRLQPNGTTTMVATMNIISQEEFWNRFREAYQQDDMITIADTQRQVGFPARQIHTVELRACLPHEIPPRELT